MGRSNLSKIEQAESRTVSSATLDKLLDLYGVDDPAVRASLHELAKLAGEKGWWVRYKDLMPQMLADFEAEACPAHLRSPGDSGSTANPRLRRRDLSRQPNPRGDEIAQRVAVRIKRQEILHRVDPPTYMAILDEAVLHRRLGSPEVMREQLRHLVHLAARHNIDLYVLPFSAGAHPATEGSFVVMDFLDPRDASIAYLETPVTSMYPEEDRQVRLFNDMFGSAQSCSMTAAQSLTFIDRRLHDLEEWLQ
ncbi:hypothetical protein SUDANB121_01198 [Nocardiopsis dassonvillei]|uniref:DUF5753 domain-containing protein n=1 Tax=Nocardiopsis dassonvillei TaxID=2014 RepID=UPI003F56A2E7